jgi:hypothetical protein
MDKDKSLYLVTEHDETGKRVGFEVSEDLEKLEGRYPKGLSPLGWRTRLWECKEIVFREIK